MSSTSAHFFTGSFKARNRIVASAAIVIASAAPFAIALVVITYFVADPNDWLAGIVTVAAFLAAGGSTWVVQNRFALLGNAWLRGKLQSCHADADPMKNADTQQTFVGFAPGDGIRTWEGETDLDVGFLCVSGDAVVFLGDRFTWSLARDRIDRVDLTPAPLGPRRIVVHWHAPREPRRSFTLESREANSLKEADARTLDLFKRVRQWTLRESEGAGLTHPLGYPPTDNQGGRPIDEPAAGSCVTTIAMMVIIILTIWYLVGEMLDDRFYYHAVLWAGFVFVGGTVFTRCLLHYLQSSTALGDRHKSPGRA